MKTAFTAMLAMVLLPINAYGQTTRPAKVTVHEWGTFTNFAGADGVYLDFRPLFDSDLPAFVFDRSMQYNLLADKPLLKSSPFVKSRTYSRTRMETPVTYFYTDQLTEVSVRVDLPKGVLTDFYPPVRAMGPEFKKDAALDSTGNSYLDWGKILLTPQELAVGKLAPPPVKEGDHYAAARETDSAVVMFYDPSSNGSGVEKFLFYRGIGSFQLPIALTNTTSNDFQVNHTVSGGIQGAILVDISGQKVRFSVHHNLAATTKLSLPEGESTVDQLANAMTDLLTAEGLYEKEARAMVKTWRSSWFAEEGTRLLYIVPQRMTDELLPLHVSPTPEKTVRVMVGRLEVLTQNRETQIAALVRGMGADDFMTREASYQQLRQLGRFTEPALQRLVKTTKEPEVRSRSEKLLIDMRSGK